MYPVSTQWVAELVRPDQRRIFRLDVLDGGKVIASGLRITGGAVQVDGTADIRRRFDAVVVDPTGVLIPNDASDVLSPYGYEVRIWTGFRYLNGVEELVPLGTMRIATAKVVDNGAQTVALSGYDRSRAISRARFEVPYSVASGQNYITAIQALLVSRVPSIEFRSVTTTATTPVLLFEQMTDPWQAAQKMVEAIGCEMFFDPMGVCVIRTQQSVDTAQLTYTYQEGRTAVILSADNVLQDDPGYNGAVVDGEPTTGSPVHSVVYDTDSTSPTNSAGRYGKVPIFLRSQYIASQSQADDAALAELRRNKGGTEQLQFSALPNGAHDAGDLVRVVRAAIGVAGYYVVETFSIPLSAADAMQISTQKRRSVA